MTLTYQMPEKLIMNADPIVQFELWYQEQIQQKLEPISDAVILSTVNSQSEPSSRVMLFKGLVQDNRSPIKAFSFYTNYQSKKGDELNQNTNASLLFFWPHLYRQIRIEGVALQASREQSEKYFSTRPRESQLGAWASHQSQPINNYDIFMKLYQEFEKKFMNQDVPCPPNWGGFNLVAKRIEFWVGRDFRLHERYLYHWNSETKTWSTQMLSP